MGDLAPATTPVAGPHRIAVSGPSSWTWDRGGGVRRAGSLSRGRRERAGHATPLPELSRDPFPPLEPSVWARGTPQVSGVQRGKRAQRWAGVRGLGHLPIARTSCDGCVLPGCSTAENQRFSSGLPSFAFLPRARMGSRGGRSLATQELSWGPGGAL